MTQKHVMLYDGDCAFCRRWVSRLHRMTGDRVWYEAYQKVLPDFPKVTEAECQSAVQLVTSEGSVFSGARALFKALQLSGRLRFVLWCYEHIPLFGQLSEWVYQWVAGHRRFLSNPSRL